MKRNTRSVISVLACLATLHAVAGEAPATAKPSGKGSNVSSEKGKTGEMAISVSTVTTAHSLARYGDANKDPLALITAARLLQETGSGPARVTRIGAASTESKSKADKYSVAALLERARALSEGRPDMLALAEDVAKSRGRGNTNGPAHHWDVVKSNATDIYRITFRGGEKATVAVDGDGDSDIDLYVYDENNNPICKDDDATDTMICNWYPRWTGEYRIKIVNRGIANRYLLLTN